MFTWVLLFHIAGLVFWIGGLLVATTLLAQHAREETAEGQLALAQAGMRMLNAMANPGAILTIATGIVLVAIGDPGAPHEVWFQSKMVLVATLIILHGIAYFRARRFVTGALLAPRKSWMILHGAISLVFLAALVCVLPGRAYWK
ncbi:MAG: CopD family protein [Terriglobia bacterium]